MQNLSLTPLETESQSHRMKAVPAAQAAVGRPSNRKRAKSAVEQKFLAVRAERSLCGLLAVHALGHELNCAGLRGRSRNKFHDLSSSWQQLEAVKNVRVGSLEAVIKSSIRVAQNASIDFVDSEVVERVRPGIAARLAFEGLREDPSVVLHRGLRVHVHGGDGVVGRGVLLNNEKIIKFFIFK